MSAQHTRLRASERPEQTRRWSGVWIASDRRAPFKVEQRRARAARRWWQL